MAYIRRELIRTQRSRASLDTHYRVSWSPKPDSLRSSLSRDPLISAYWVNNSHENVNIGTLIFILHVLETNVPWIRVTDLVCVVKSKGERNGCTPAHFLFVVFILRFWLWRSWKCCHIKVSFSLNPCCVSFFIFSFFSGCSFLMALCFYIWILPDQVKQRVKSRLCLVCTNFVGNYASTL